MKTRFILIVCVAALSLAVAAVRVLHVSVARNKSPLSAEHVIGPVPVHLPEAFAGLPRHATGEQLAERIHALGRNVSQQEQLALAAWMTSRPSGSYPQTTRLYLLNEVMDVLCHQNHPLGSLTGLLLAIVRDDGIESGERDYAIQHLVDWIEPMNAGEPYESNPIQRSTIIKTLIEAAEKSREDLAGTALEALHLILETEQVKAVRPNSARPLPLPFTVGELKHLAINLATGPVATDADRITAFQVCAQRSFDEVLPDARRIAADRNRFLMLRSSAIATVGQLGNAADETLLGKVKEEQNLRLNKAVEPALRKIKNRAMALIQSPGAEWGS